MSNIIFLSLKTETTCLILFFVIIKNRQNMSYIVFVTSIERGISCLILSEITSTEITGLTFLCYN